LKVIFICNFRKKVILFTSILILWVALFLLSSFFIHNSLVFNVTINDKFKFSYPFAIKIDDIFVNDTVATCVITENTVFRKPITQNLSTFKSQEGRFSFQYPSSFLLNQKYFPGSDILYHIDFHSPSHNSYGFVQVWELPYSLENFLNKSKQASTQTFKSFASKAITIHDIPGYYWEYSVLSNNNIYYKGIEAFLKKDDKMYRISYFIPETNWTKADSDEFWTIVNSFNTF
jgi:hypothetical protein